MSFLFRIVYAAHANGTHHKLALDALNRLEGSDAERWRNVMLKHVTLYLEGSKAPDTQFKDFKNHVLHVADDYWGGAPEKVESWYVHLVTALRNAAWSEAAFCAGVLSHYYTDPIQPLHTGQTEAENAIHRAVEWSISRSYDDLARLGRERFPALQVAVPDGQYWIKDMVCRGAETSHRYYEKLIAHYDIHRGVVDPPAGLDQIARVAIAELIVYASTGFARILERAFAESGATPPDVSLTPEAFLATLRIPSKWIEKKLANAEDRALVHRMYDELKATGRVEANLPEDDRIVRDLYQKEVLAPRAARQAALRAERLPQSDPLKRQPRKSGSGSLAALTPKAPPAPSHETRAAARTPSAAPAELDAHLGRTSTPRIYLKGSDDLEAAPSIGPRSATWFADLGIVTVEDFLSSDPETTAELLSPHGLTADVIIAWQDQARLVMTVPGLRGTHAQLLVGAGYHDSAAIAAASESDLSASVLRFASTPEGQRVLRQGEPPDIAKMKEWIENAARRQDAAAA